MRKFNYVLFALSLGLLLNSCSKGDGKKPQAAIKNSQITIHMLSRTIFVQGKCQIDISQSEVDAAPVVRNNEILGYSADEHRFYVTTAAFKKIEAAADKIGFVVALNNQAVYYGVYKPMTSSSSCDQSITMSQWKIANENILAINLGYPGGGIGLTIEDNRNHEDLIEVLESQGKLR